MFSVVSVFVAVSLLSCLSGQQLLAGPCSAFGVSNVENFFPESFIGNWFLYGTFDEGMPLHDFDCIQFVHKLSSYGNLRTTEYATDLASKTSHKSFSRMVFPTLGEGFYLYKTGDISEETQIISTDNSNYYIEFNCADEENGEANCYVGIFTKLPQPSDSTVNEINEFFSDHNIDLTNLRFIEHSDLKCNNQCEFFIKETF